MKILRDRNTQKRKGTEYNFFNVTISPQIVNVGKHDLGELCI